MHFVLKNVYYSFATNPHIKNALNQEFSMANQ